MHEATSVLALHTPRAVLSQSPRQAAAACAHMPVHTDAVLLQLPPFRQDAPHTQELNDKGISFDAIRWLQVAPSACLSVRAASASISAHLQQPPPLASSPPLPSPPSRYHRRGAYRVVIRSHACRSNNARTNKHEKQSHFAARPATVIYFRSPGVDVALPAQEFNRCQ